MRPLIGREEEVRSICSLLQEGRVRLLTLSGPGGVGKTRLAMQVAQEMVTHASLFADGCCFVSLAPIREKELVLPTIMQALGVKEARQRSSLVMLKMALREKHVLLVLDNLEQVAEAAPLLHELVAYCPGLKLLITSRELLHLRDEYEFRVAPLALPDLKRLPDCEVLSHTASVVLFVERVQMVVPHFQLTPANARTIAEICVRLDGLPLALELAAARMKVLSPQSLLARLNRRLALLTGGKQDVPERQQTLRRTIEWSHQLLLERERLLFQRLAVFVGGATLGAIEVVWTSLEGQEDTHLLDLVTSLVDKNLLQVQSMEEGEEPRFTMLETIREYALEQLEQSDEQDRLRLAHALHYLTLAEGAAPKMIGPEQIMQIRLLERDHDNLRAAMSWLLATQKTELALRGCNALWLFWAQNHTQEGYRWVNQVLALDNEHGNNVEERVRAWGYYSAAALGRYAGHPAQSMMYCRQSLELFRRIGDQEGIAIALNGLGHLALEVNDYATVQAVSEESLPLIRLSGNRWRLSESLFLCAYRAYFRGDYVSAYELGEECLAVCRTVGEPVTVIRVLFALGLFAYVQKKYKTAQTYYEEGLSLARSTIVAGRDAVVAICLVGLGCVAAAQGQPIQAVRLWGVSNTLYENVMHGTTGDLGVYDYLATLLRTQLRYDAAVAAVRDTLGEQTFRRAWQEGQGMSLDQVLSSPEPLSPVMPAKETEKEKGARSGGQRLAHEELTPREMEVLRLLAQGATSAQIARQLSITVLTVNSHVRSIYSKLGVTSRSAATRYAVEQKLL